MRPAPSQVLPVTPLYAIPFFSRGFGDQREPHPRPTDPGQRKRTMSERRAGRASADENKHRAPNVFKQLREEGLNLDDGIDATTHAPEVDDESRGTS